MQSLPACVVPQTRLITHLQQGSCLEGALAGQRHAVDAEQLIALLDARRVRR